MAAHKKTTLRWFFYLPASGQIQRPYPGQQICFIDLQRAMLLRLHNPDGARTWIWVERLAEPSRWLDLRRALLAHA